MQLHGAVLRTNTRATLAALACALAACASRPPPPEIDLRNAALVPDPSAPALVIDGIAGKGGGAAAGAATGLGSGVLVGGAACLATGPFFALCLAAVVPTTMAIGTVAGGVTGSVRSESADAVDSKVAMIKAELAATSYPGLLVEQLQRQAGDDFSTVLPLLAARAASAPAAPGGAAGAGLPVVLSASEPDWLVEVALTEVGTEGKAEYALRVVARLRFFRRGEATARFETAKEVQSETELTTAQWRADDGEALRGVLGLCVRRVARNLLGLVIASRRDGAGPSPPVARSRYSSSCDDVATDWQRPASVPQRTD